MIRGTVDVRDRRGLVRDRVVTVSAVALDAAANVYEREVKRAHADHYTSGDFRGTLAVRQSIRRTMPTRDGNGRLSASIGTKLPQPLYWEMGHHNLFTRKYERRRIWVPTVLAAKDRIVAAYARVLGRMMRRG